MNAFLDIMNTHKCALVYKSLFKMHKQFITGMCYSASLMLFVFVIWYSSYRCRMTGAEDFVLKPLHLRDIQRLRSYVKPRTPRTKTGTKRKVPLDMMPESNRSERQTRPAGVVVS